VRASRTHSGDRPRPPPVMRATTTLEDALERLAALWFPQVRAGVHKSFARCKRDIPARHLIGSDHAVSASRDASVAVPQSAGTRARVAARGVAGGAAQLFRGAARVGGVDRYRACGVPRGSGGASGRGQAGAGDHRGGAAAARSQEALQLARLCRGVACPAGLRVLLAGRYCIGQDGPLGRRAYHYWAWRPAAAVGAWSGWCSRGHRPGAGQAGPRAGGVVGDGARPRRRGNCRQNRTQRGFRDG
jgi:hypothetical protein